MKVAASPAQQLIWDWPTRCFHWLLVLAMVALFVTGKLGGNLMEWHARAGYTVLGLVAFRLCWGVVGSTTARFSNFVRGPKIILSWLRGRQRDSAGHNPLGALSVVAMILLIGIQAATGMFANDDVMTEGPYAAVVGKDVSDALTQVHKINSNVIAGLTLLHLAAIIVHATRKGRGFILAMVTGRNKVPASEPLSFAPSWLAILLAVAIAIAVSSLVNKGPPFG